MAESGLQFIIARDRGLMTIGATTVPVDCSALDPEIRNVFWRGATGQVTYNADAGNAHNMIPALVTDPSPYQALINAWCTAQAAAAPAIGLGQVQQIKKALVEILYDSKRQAPIAFTVGAGALTWNAGDDETAAMQQTLSVEAIGLLQTLATDLAGDFSSIISTAGSGIVNPFAALVAGINTALSSLAAAVTGAVNTNVVDALNTEIGDNGHAATLNFFLNNINNAIPSGVPYNTLSELGHLTDIALTPPTVSGSESFSPTITAFSALVSSIPWIPFGATATVNITNLELAGILGAILARRQALQSARLAKEAAIAALGTVAAAIAYDATAGWP